MRSRTFVTAVFLAALATAGAGAQPPASPAPPRLYTLDKAAQPEVSRQLAPDAVEEFLIQVDPELVAANPRALILELPGHGPLEVVRTRFVDYRPDWKSWFGTLRLAGGETGGQVYLGYHGGKLTALVDYRSERFRIVGDARKGHRLARLSDDLSPPSCAVDTTTQPTDTPAFLHPELPDEKPGSSSVPGDKTTARLDLLIVYPRAFFALGSSAVTDLEDFVEDSVALANQAFTNSNVDAYYNLIGVAPIIGSSQPNSGLTSGNSWMNGSPAELTGLRDAYGADIVALYIPFSWNSPDRCGIANLPQAGGGMLGGPGNFNQRAFSVHRVDCGLDDFTLAHEIGHNYGMHHDFDQTPDPLPLFANSLGYVFSVGGTTKATVMGCHCTGCFCTSSCVLGSGAVCNRIPHFSDPAINYLGVPTGTSTRNNAAVGRAQVSGYAAFRNVSTNTPPTANFTVSCLGRTCTFNASSSSDNTAIPSGGYWWAFGDGSFGSGVSVTKTYTSVSTFNVYLVVTDSGGQTGVKMKTATTTPPVYEGYHEVGHCRDISGWAWDQTAPNTPINVDLYRDSTLVTSVAANVFRSDLLSAGKGNGFHAFGYTPNSSWKDGVWHAARARFGGTSTHLSWSPINIICGVTCFTSQTPTENADTLGVVYTVATQFSSAHNGYITHLRFYRAAGETGTNVGKLWTNGGTLLAQATFPSSPSSGWVEVALSSPVAITAGTLYRVSVNTNVRQSKTGCGIGSGITNQSVMTAHQGFWIAGNGVFPTTGSCSNFFVDVKFDL